MAQSAVNLAAIAGSAWHVASDAIMKALGHATGSASPIGSVVPAFIGQEYYDTVAKVFYRAVDVTNADWTVIGDPGLSAAELSVLDGVTAGTPLASKAVVLDAAGGIGAFRGSRNLSVQAAPAAKSTTTTLTAAEIMGGILTANQAGGAGASYTLPLATDLETALLAAFPGLAVNDSFDFTLINISTVAAEDVTILTNTGWTLVGLMKVDSNDADTSPASAVFRVRRTAANTYTLYRVG